MTNSDRILWQIIKDISEEDPSKKLDGIILFKLIGDYGLEKYREGFEYCNEVIKKDENK